MLASRLDRFTNRKDPRYPLHRRLGGPTAGNGEVLCFFVLFLLFFFRYGLKSDIIYTSFGFKGLTDIVDTKSLLCTVVIKFDTTCFLL
jgi:hypothetical protein